MSIPESTIPFVSKAEESLLHIPAPLFSRTESFMESGSFDVTSMMLLSLKSFEHYRDNIRKRSFEEQRNFDRMELFCNLAFHLIRADKQLWRHPVVARPCDRFHALGYALESYRLSDENVEGDCGEHNLRLMSVLQPFPRFHFRFFVLAGTSVFDSVSLLFTSPVSPVSVDEVLSRVSSRLFHRERVRLR